MVKTCSFIESMQWCWYYSCVLQPTLESSSKNSPKPDITPMQYITTALRMKAIVAYTLPITFLTAVHSASLVEQARWTAHKDRSSLCIRDSLILIFTQTDMSDGWYYWLYHCLMLHTSCPLLTTVCVLVGFNRAPAVFMAEMCVPLILIIHIVTNGLRSPPS